MKKQNKDIVWVDIDYNYYTLKELSDNYLLNILKYLQRGKGYLHLVEKRDIRKLFNEAKRRNLILSNDITLDTLFTVYDEAQEYLKKMKEPKLFSIIKGNLANKRVM